MSLGVCLLLLVVCGICWLGLDYLQAKIAANQIMGRRCGYKSRIKAGKHVRGLPLVEDAICSVDMSEGEFKFCSGSTTIILKMDKVVDVMDVTDKQVLQSVTPSISGAVAGAALFGTLGAVIGGRARTHTKEQNVHYIVFNYINQGNAMSNICLELSDRLDIEESRIMSGIFHHDRPNQPTQIEL